MILSPSAAVCAGSPLYMAPEVQPWWPSYQQTRQLQYDKADLWSIGCILHFVLCKQTLCKLSTRWIAKGVYRFCSDVHQLFLVGRLYQTLSLCHSRCLAALCFSVSLSVCLCVSISRSFS